MLETSSPTSQPITAKETTTTTTRSSSRSSTPSQTLPIPSRSPSPSSSLSPIPSSTLLEQQQQLNQPSTPPNANDTNNSEDSIGFVKTSILSGLSSSAKKRRKQSNPVRYGNTDHQVKKVKTSSRPRRRPRSEDDDADEEEEEDDNHSVLSGGPYPDMDQEEEEGERITGDLEGDEDSEDPFFCPHCSSSFPSPSLLKAHIEEEHVLKLLERQLLQYQSMSGMKSQPTNGQQLDIPVDPQQLMATLAAASRGGHPPHHLLQRQQLNQQQRPPSRTSSRSSSGSNPPESPRKSSFDQSGLRGMDIAGFPFPIPGPTPGHEGKGLPIGMFPNPMAPFLFPVLPPGHPGAGAGGGQRSPGSSSGPPGNFGIFNPEAYCDICNKEFCNKYFLKTHKANKHGIYTDGVPPPTSSASSSSSSSTPSVTTISGSGNGGGGGQFNPSAVSAAAAAASAFFPAGLNSSSIGNQGGVPDGPLQQLHQQQLAASMAARIMGTVSNPESWCEICQKEFCNKYFLKKHKQKIHGIEISGGSTSGQPGSSQASNDGSLSDGSGKAPPSPMTPPPPSSSHSQQPQSTPVNMTTTTATNGESGGSSNRTTLEGLDAFVYCSKFFIGNKGGGNTNSNNSGNQNLPPSSSSPKSSRDQQQHLFELAMSQQPTTKVNGQASHHSITSPPTSLSGNIPNNLPISQSFSSSLSTSTNTLPPPPPPPQPNTMNSPKNYCNICNKELCNKYFMKTHMLKMHGINIDEQPAEAAVSSTIGGVTCDICQKELCSKYFLKVHKQNTHGIYEESGGKESSGGRRGNSSSSQSVRASQLEQSSWSQQQDSTSNDGQTNDFQRGERSSSDKEPSAKGIDPKDTGNRYFSHYTEVCPLCERRFKSIKWLQTHLKNDHMERGQQPPFLDGDHQPQHLQGVPSSLPGLPPGLLPMFPDPEAALNFVMSASKSGNIPPGIVSNQILGQQQFLKRERESPKGVDNSNSTSPPVSIAALKWLKSHISPEEGRPQSTSGQPDEEPNRGKEQSRESGSPSKNSTSNSTSMSHPLPTAYAIPQKPTAGPFIMQPFLICSQQSEENSSTGSNESKSSTLGDTFVPSLVYLPVSKKIVQPVTVAFQLTPA